MLLIFILCFIRFEISKSETNVLPIAQEPLKLFQDSDNIQKTDNGSNLRSVINLNSSGFNDTSLITMLSMQATTSSILKITTPESLMKQMLSMKNYKKLCGNDKVSETNFKVDTDFFNKNKDIECGRKSFLLFAVLSHVSNFAMREKIRQSWGSIRQLKSKKLTVIFFIYSEKPFTKEEISIMEKERSDYMDTVRIEVARNPHSDVEIYLKMFQFIIFGCEKPNYFVFINEAMFVNIPTLLEAILTHRDISKPSSKEHSLFLCKVKKNSIAIRNKKSPWFVGSQDWSDKHYPPYCDILQGMVISGDILRDMLMCSFFSKKLWIADVFLTGILPQKLEITIEDFLEDFSTNQMMNHHIEGDMSHNVFLTEGRGFNDQTWRLIFNRSLREL